MTKELSVLHTIAGLHPRSGGTSRVVVDLLDALCEQNLIQPVLVTQSLNDEPVVNSSNPRVRRVIVEMTSKHLIKFGFPFRKALQKVVEESERILIHNHGLWMSVNHWACRVAYKHNIALIIQPHGMLEPRALSHKMWKKNIAMFLFQRDDLKSAKVLIATSKKEYENIRKLGFRQPIAIIPNGVKVGVEQNTVKCLSQYNEDIRTVLFLSRIHPIKGLENLVRAWAKLVPKGWRLRFAGPDEGGYIQYIMKLVRELGIEKSVEYIGMVDGEPKLRAFREADLFVLPTYSENFGMVVAEALAHKVPVITTRGAPWADLETYKCGWWIDIGVEPLIKTLREAMTLTDGERQGMGERGYGYVKRYDWDHIAQQTNDVYSWVLGLGPMPSCIVLD